MRYLIVGLILSAAAAAHANPPVDTGIQALAARVEKAWAGGDAAALGRQFTPDGDTVGVTGALTHGADQIAAHYAQVFGAQMKGAKLTINIQSVRMLGKNAAVVDNTQIVNLADGGVRRVRAAWAVERDHGIWKLVHAQNTTLAPPTASETATQR